MVFSFSFNLSVPGIINPFTAAAEAEAAAVNSDQASLPKLHLDGDVLPPSLSTVPARRPPSPSILPPVSKKRGWVPSYPEPSRPAPMHASTSGYLDTPAKYRDMVYENADQEEMEELVADLPPPKRRRTLAGSLISTALSAALIGTAVGLTVYRLWRDRGKNPEPLPPPPYEQGEWVPPEPENSHLPTTPTLKPATTPRSRKSRHVATRRTIPRHRKTPSRAGPSTHHYGQPSYQASRSPIPPEFNFASGSRSSPKPTEDADMDDQMSWMGSRLAQLIAEGQKALGKEVVIMSEDQADEVDDGSGAWVEEDESSAAGSSRRLDSGLPPYSIPGSPRSKRKASPARSRFERAASVESDTRSVASSFREDESSWATLDMRESMERARTLYRQKRGL
ncbi:hypothetical protein GSI_12809 [Ganoderma sinense ZZ0214-1]|uniref:Uncharacterized protein n=1 Tax=Ganoderma sinense ZZ0214-1 TaxID=1077348 RepID=A0A2G8RTS6_9APHY|nr:hypothetical protein GSI_12809 [Ganoderma sinense ZZ0214-1]